MAGLNLNFNTNFGGNFKIDYSPGEVTQLKKLENITIQDNQYTGDLSVNSASNYSNNSFVGTETMDFSLETNSTSPSDMNINTSSQSLNSNIANSSNTTQYSNFNATSTSPSNMNINTSSQSLNSITFISSALFSLIK